MELIIGDLQSGKSTELVRLVQTNLPKRPQVVVTTNSEVCLKNLLPRFSKDAHIFTSEHLPTLYTQQKRGMPLPENLLIVVMANHIQFQKVKDIFVGTGIEFDLYIDEADIFNLKGNTTSVQRNNVISWIAGTLEKPNTNIVNNKHFTATPHNPFFTEIEYDKITVIEPGPGYKGLKDIKLEEAGDFDEQLSYELSLPGKRIILVAKDKLQKDHKILAGYISKEHPKALVVVVNSASGNKAWLNGRNFRVDYSGDIEVYFETAKTLKIDKVVFVGHDVFTRAVTFKDRDAEYEYGAMFVKMARNQKNLVSIIQKIGRQAGYQSFASTCYCNNVNRLQHGIDIHLLTLEDVKKNADKIFSDQLKYRREWLRNTKGIEQWQFDPYEKVNNFRNAKSREYIVSKEIDNENCLSTPFSFPITPEISEICKSRAPSRSALFVRAVKNALRKELDNIREEDLDKITFAKVPASSNDSLVTWWQDPAIFKPESDHRSVIYHVLEDTVRCSYQPVYHDHGLEENQKYQLYNPYLNIFEDFTFSEPAKKGKVKRG